MHLIEAKVVITANESFGTHGLMAAHKSTVAHGVSQLRMACSGED